MSNEFDKLNRQVKFIESHVGGDLNDTNKEFNNQKNILNNRSDIYLDLLDDTNTLSRTKNNQNIQNITKSQLSNSSANTTGDVSSEYQREKRKEYYSKDERINNFPLIINEDINISNPIIYPKEYDEYYEYLHKKSIKSINTQVIQKKTYINIDSANRNLISSMNVESYIQLTPNPLIFENNTNTMKIKIAKSLHNFVVGDQITLQGYEFYKQTYKFINLYFTHGTNVVILDLEPNFTVPIPYYNILIEISGLTNGLNGYYKNIPLNVLNNIQTIKFYTTLSNEKKLSFEIPMNFYTDNTTSNVFTSSCSIKYYFIGNYPINYINSGVPTSLYNLNEYLLVDSVENDYLLIRLTDTLSLQYSNSIQISGNWINSNIFETGGPNIQIGKIININYAYPKSSNYRIIFTKRIDNVACIKMKSSEIPNTTKLVYSLTNSNNVTIGNNLFYWKNALDIPNNLYNITVPVGNYSPTELSTLMEKLISMVPRKIEIPNPTTNLIPFNNIKITINQNNNLTQLISYNTYKLPQSICNLETDSVNLIWILTINHPYHNQSVGSKIIIENSSDYLNIDKKYINKDHIITNIQGNDYYQITLTNINLLNYSVDTKGGNELRILTLNPFQLFFDKPNTIGELLGFRNTGSPGSITQYSSQSNNYILDNSQPYIYGTENILIINNLKEVQVSNDFKFDVGRYILLVCKNQSLNQCLNPNGIEYFYKIQLDGDLGSIMFNTYVDNPIYFNPPIKYIDEFEFKFLTDKGEEYEFYGIDNSMTFEITSVTNSPENTNLPTYIARM
jgi:hypothetical protein